MWRGYKFLISRHEIDFFIFSRIYRYRFPCDLKVTAVVCIWLKKHQGNLQQIKHLSSTMCKNDHGRSGVSASSLLVFTSRPNVAAASGVS